MLRDCKYPFKTPDLPFSYGELEPHFTSITFEYHHDKHFNAYVNNLNKTLENYPDLQDKTLKELLSDLDSIPSEIRSAVRNNGGGVFNHDLYFLLMSPKFNQKIPKQIIDAFSSEENFLKELKDCAMKTFGSGFAWLVKTNEGDLKIISLPNQDTPYSLGYNPILCLDVWEHAYYLNYQNLRGDYIDNFLAVVNWEFVSDLL